MTPRRIHFLLPVEESRYGTACSPALTIVGGKRAAVVSKQLTSSPKLVTCRTCALMVQAALSIHAGQAGLETR